jgi:CHAD domain-containing protein
MKDFPDYARKTAGTLLDRVAFQVHRVARMPKPDSIHDLRVAIRRFTQSLRIFRDFFPRTEAKRVRAQLSELMDLAGEVRNRDIAIELLAKAGVDGNSRFVSAFQLDRDATARRLSRAVRRWHRRDFSQKWRNRLEL